MKVKIDVYTALVAVQGGRRQWQLCGGRVAIDVVDDVTVYYLKRRGCNDGQDEAFFVQQCMGAGGVLPVVAAGAYCIRM